MDLALSGLCGFLISLTLKGSNMPALGNALLRMRMIIGSYIPQILSISKILS
jgi:hypothetical protein